MTQPEELRKDTSLLWSTGKGTDVWDMFCAAKAGDIPTMKTLLEKDPTLYRSEFDYRNPMSFAVRENQPEAVAFLLEQGASPISSGTNDTLLQIARDRGHEEIKHLLETAIGGKKGTAGGTIMAEAIRSRDLQKVRELLDASPEYVSGLDENTNQPIHWAVMTRQPEMIDEVLSRGADINAERADGARPLQLCNGDYGFRGWRDVPKEGNPTPREIYDHLIKSGAYLDIYMAAVTGNLERVKELLDEDPTLVNGIAKYVSYYAGGGSLIKNAAIGGNIEIMRLLLERGADPNLPEEGIAPQGHALHSAALSGNMEMVKLLLDHGAHPNVPIESSADTLSAMINSNNQPMINLLCSHGASRSVDLLAYYGDIQTAAAVFAANPALANNPRAMENALIEGHEDLAHLMLRYHPELTKHIAAGVTSKGPQGAIKSREMTEYLFQQGMDPNHANWLHITPLHRFAQRGDQESADIYLQHGADINAIDEEFYSTPLGYAAKYGKKEMVEFLLSKGANPDLPKEHPWAQPLQWAKRRGHTEIVNLLE
ncbi:ankyrin repeat domain-containing protein [Chitinophaga sp. SYP-B3965]|uniref:ankyrin repeat domain-containing protein n=1 Tax=Chitinophaga sp. SYP-B3965 TaxID=2663120 RepID=UPI001299D540|nr:ankyrin repeat domain-containing protein [Chitinophaga sp. SYP-B3965]MRG45560.1 ankyrin repeat domain-containing protein [Chitinophaga sp. SYP-B3965]